LPEALLQGRERILIQWFFSQKTANPAATFTREDIDEYERVYASLGGMRGMLGNYRAVLEDMEQNAELATRELRIPVLAFGGDAGSAPDLYERLQPFCADIRGGLIRDSGHYIPEEQPQVNAHEIIAFLDTLPS
jgi:pimeloyl-ACP methyl ester carboxylesterase